VSPRADSVTAGQDVQRLMNILAGCVSHGTLSATDGALLAAGLTAAVEEDQHPVSPRRLGVLRSARKTALMLLAEQRTVFYQSTQQRLVRALARDSRFDVDAAWRLLRESVDMIVGLDNGDIDPAAILGLGVPGSVQDKRTVLESDAETDAMRALAYLLATACPPRRGDPDPAVVSLAERRQLAASAGAIR
jgi:hypothetical protein